MKCERCNRKSSDDCFISQCHCLEMIIFLCKDCYNKWILFDSCDEVFKKLNLLQCMILRYNNGGICDFKINDIFDKNIKAFKDAVSKFKDFMNQKV